MSETTAELIRICEALPTDKQAEVADFARFLLARQSDDAWEERIADRHPRRRLDEFLQASAAEGEAPLDLAHL